MIILIKIIKIILYHSGIISASVNNYNNKILIRRLFYRATVMMLKAVAKQRTAMAGGVGTFEVLTLYLCKSCARQLVPKRHWYQHSAYKIHNRTRKNACTIHIRTKRMCMYNSQYNRENIHVQFTVEHRGNACTIFPIETKRNCMCNSQ